MSQSKKSVSVTVDVNLSKRLMLLRQLRHRTPNLGNELEAAIKELCEKYESRLYLSPTSWQDAKSCPSCTTGVLLIKQKRNTPSATPFYGCSHYPKCSHKESVPSKNKKSRRG